MTQAFTFRFEDREIEARPGQSLAAALLAAGEAGLRETRTAGLRGLYCGMGVCQECRVSIDGEEQQLACRVRCADGMRIDTGERQ